MNADLGLARELLARVEAKRETASHYIDHTPECRDDPDGHLSCECPLALDDLLDDLVDELRHLVWLADLHPAVAS